MILLICIFKLSKVVVLFSTFSKRLIVYPHSFHLTGGIDKWNLDKWIYLEIHPLISIITELCELIKWSLSFMRRKFQKYFNLKMKIMCTIIETG